MDRKTPNRVRQWLRKPGAEPCLEMARGPCRAGRRRASSDRGSTRRWTGGRASAQVRLTTKPRSGGVFYFIGD